MMISQVLRFLDTYVRNKDVLEVGSGIGTFCNEAYKTAKEVVAIDVENKASYVAKAKNLSFRLMDATKMEFRPAVFDTVVFYDTIGFLENEFEQIIQESLRVLREDGQILICSTQSYDRMVLEKKVVPYLQSQELGIKLSMYQTMKVVCITKHKKVGINYKELKEKQAL